MGFKLKKNKVNKKTAKIPPRVKKAFAVSSSLLTLIGNMQTANPKLIALRSKIKDAMLVFNYKVGEKNYYEITLKIKEFWTSLHDKYDTELTLESYVIYIEYLSTLIHPKDHKEYLDLSPYQSPIDPSEIDPDVHKKIAYAVLEFDQMLNNYFDTSSYTLTLPAKKEIKVKKTRDKPQKKEPQNNTISRGKRKYLDGQKRKEEFLKSIKARVAKGKKNTTHADE